MRNEYEYVDESTVRVFLTKNKSTLIDAADLPLLEEYLWHVHKNSRSDRYYAQTNKPLGQCKYTTLALHRHILGEPEGQVDHINTDTLDNRRSNLRVVSQSQNSCNRSATCKSKTGIKNIHWHSVDQKFVVKITVNKRVTRKYFKDLNAAVEYRNQMLPKLHGEFARLN